MLHFQAIPNYGQAKHRDASALKDGEEHILRDVTVSDVNKTQYDQ